MSEAPLPVLAGRPVVMAYPVRFTEEGASTTVQFCDFPDLDILAKRGEDPFSTARLALHDEISARIRAKAEIPAPTVKPKRGRGTLGLVPLDQTLAMKALLWDNMRAGGVSNMQLARALGCDEKEVRRLLDPSTTSRSLLSRALELVTGSLVAVTIVDTAQGARLMRAPNEKRGHTLASAVTLPGRSEA